MTIDYGLWNALASTATLLVVAATAVAALRQLRHLRGQNTLNGLLKVLGDWRDPQFQQWLTYVRHELPKRTADPEFMAELDGIVDRSRHPELNICDWYEQIGSYLKYGLLDERTMMDVSWSSCNTHWALLRPVIERLRQSRGLKVYENFEYMAARGVLFHRAHPDGCYPPGTPRMDELESTAARETVLSPPVQRASEAAASDPR